MKFKLTEEMIQPNQPKVIAEGITTDNEHGLNMTGSGETLKWVVTRGNNYDWAVYTHWSNFSTEVILRNGDKVKDKRNILNIIECSDELLKKYRY